MAATAKNQHQLAERGSDRRLYLHRIYDLVVASDRPLPAPRSSSRIPHLTITEHEHRRLPGKPYNLFGYTYEKLNDGSVHVSWSDLFDFIVSRDGSRIDVHAEATWDREPVYTYLLSQIVSVALLSKDIDSWHGSAVQLNDTAIVLLGNCAYGKSTLTAALVQAGAKLLTDDLVVMRNDGNVYDVAPGAQRLKLDPRTAASLGVDWPSVAMQDGSGKHVYLLGARNCSAVSVRLRELVLLQPSDRFAVEKVERVDGIRAVLAATFNPLQTDACRLQKLMHTAQRIVAQVPITRLHVPRSLPRLDEVVRYLRTERHFHEWSANQSAD